MINKFIHSKLFKQLFRFGIVGFTAFLIDAGLLYVLTDFLHIHYLISSVISFIVSLIYNYILSIFWVFDVKKKQTYKEVLLFTILSVIGLGINQLVMYVGVDFLNIYYMLCKIMATIIVMIYNFITRKIFIEK
ncbi:MAG: GtrA family protein [Bacilli bacterium]